MRILTLNTWQEKGPWKDRWELIFKNIDQIQPDLIGFQEVFNPQWIKLVCERLHFQNFYWPAPSSGLFTLSRFPIKSSHWIQYQTKSPTETYDRFVTGVEIDTEYGSVYFANTHLSWLPEESLTRMDQIQELLGFLNTHQTTKYQFVVGDFNAAPHSAEIAALVQGQGFKDSYALMHPQAEGFTWFHGNSYAAGAHHKLPDRRIDYIFYRHIPKSSVQTRSCDIAMTTADSRGIYPSDHFAVVAEYDLNEEKK